MTAAKHYAAIAGIDLTALALTTAAWIKTEHLGLGFIAQVQVLILTLAVVGIVAERGVK